MLRFGNHLGNGYGPAVEALSRLVIDAGPLGVANKGIYVLDVRAIDLSGLGLSL